MTLPADLRIDPRPLLSGVADYESVLRYRGEIVGRRLGPISDDEAHGLLAAWQREQEREAEAKAAKRGSVKDGVAA